VNNEADKITLPRGHRRVWSSAVRHIRDGSENEPEDRPVGG